MVDLMCVLALRKLPIEQRHIFVWLVFQHLCICVILRICVFLCIFCICVFFYENKFARLLAPQHLLLHQSHSLTPPPPSRVEQPGCVMGCIEFQVIALYFDLNLQLYLYSPSIVYFVVHILYIMSLYIIFLSGI